MGLWGQPKVVINTPSLMHKNTKLLPRTRRELYRRWIEGDSIAELAHHYRNGFTCHWPAYPNWHHYCEEP